MREQRRGRKIAMTPDEIDAFLSSQRVCRVATIGAQDRPHVAPLWFVWDGSALWLYSIVKSRRWTDIQRRPQLAIVIDAGTEYVELHGVEISGTAEVVGEIPRMSTSNDELARPELLFGRKYFGSDMFVPRRQTRLVAGDAGQDDELGLQEALSAISGRLRFATGEPDPHITKSATLKNLKHLSSSPQPT